MIIGRNVRRYSRRTHSRRCIPRAHGYNLSTRGKYAFGASTLTLLYSFSILACQLGEGTQSATVRRRRRVNFRMRVRRGSRWTGRRLPARMRGTAQRRKGKLSSRGRLRLDDGNTGSSKGIGLCRTLGRKCALPVCCRRSGWAWRAASMGRGSASTRVAAGSRIRAGTSGRGTRACRGRSG